VTHASAPQDTSPVPRLTQLETATRTIRVGRVAKLNKRNSASIVSAAIYTKTIGITVDWKSQEYHRPNFACVRVDWIRELDLRSADPELDPYAESYDFHGTLFFKYLGDGTYMFFFDCSESRTGVTLLESGTHRHVTLEAPPPATDHNEWRVTSATIYNRSFVVHVIAHVPSYFGYGSPDESCVLRNGGQSTDPAFIDIHRTARGYEGDLGYPLKGPGTYSFRYACISPDLTKPLTLFTESG
jgi:hypothetical protein